MVEAVVTVVEDPKVDVLVLIIVDVVVVKVIVVVEVESEDVGTTLVENT